ncbi:oxygen-independent coproporphyrinogen III oxidase [Sulfitobacter sp. BDSS02]|nr:oxygen-independent coproporphyrinogen III oxidase [Sulfitobacter sp. BDSS02]MBR9851720.1 oxygen-independent coproporphyrinogen III oxidase [Paracoccaceae bacterium]
MLTQTRFSRMGLFDARVPRYTSYPTAPHFGDATGPGDFGDWIAGLTPGREISLYVHIPFCRRLCWFCACRTQGTQKQAPVVSYLETLKQELQLLAATLPKGIHLSRLHWGGGTPTLLSGDMIRDLAESIFSVAPLAGNAEFSVEIDPNELDAERVDALAEMGMTRASIGVQDFDPEIQKVIGRQQSFEITQRAADMIRDKGIESLNTDILFGLPGQSREKMTQSVQKLLSLNPDRIALYGYAHVPWMARRQSMIPSDTLPSPQERLALFDTAHELLTWDGYEAIGIDHFARPEDGLAKAQKAGRLRRNFQGYTDDQSDALIGLGASSISRLPQGYAQNAPATSAYIGHIRSGSFATTRGHRLSSEDRLHARMIEMIMCDFHIATDELVRDFGVGRDHVQRLLDRANERFENGLQVDDKGLSIPEDMRPLTRMIARQFDLYDMSVHGHSSAI